MSIAKRTYIVPLRKKFRNTQRPQRAKKAVTVLREFLGQHMKSEEIKLAKPLNEYIWAQGIKNPPGKVAIVAEKNEDGVVYADLEGNKLPSELAPAEEKKQETPAKETKKEELVAEKQEEKEATEVAEENADDEKKE